MQPATGSCSLQNDRQRWALSIEEIESNILNALRADLEETGARGGLIQVSIGRFKIEEQTITQRAREERGLPSKIASPLDELTKQQHQDNSNRYKREISKYHHEEWTVAEEINQSFLPKLKQYTVGTTQVVNAHYKGVEISRLHGRATTEIFEQLLTIQSGELLAEEANQLLVKALESAKGLAIHNWVQSKQHDEDAKDDATRAFILPPSFKHLEAKESGSKRETFSEEFIAKYNEANYQQRVLGAAITSISGGRGLKIKNYFWERGRGSIRHRERSVSNATQITTLTTTGSTTINTIDPYYNLNNELHHPLRWHSTRQSPTTFSPLLENNNPSSLVPIHNSKWLQDPIFQETDPMEESKEGSSEEEVDSTANDNRDDEQDDSNLSWRFHRCKHAAKVISEKHGFYVDGDLHETLSLSDIRFLKENEYSYE
ncbi:hypothetical protein G6F37_003917 [Rhizopus arrhizus]|nr:hypothetical protein G6F38_004086 [Rhizopus arrhizus]KAG1160518.1 hypothetical protein G6F37_003917 [Rhizopus arrhizus]